MHAAFEQLIFLARVVVHEENAEKNHRTKPLAFTQNSTQTIFRQRRPPVEYLVAVMGWCWGHGGGAGATGVGLGGCCRGWDGVGLVEGGRWVWWEGPKVCEIDENDFRIFPGNLSRSRAL